METAIKVFCTLENKPRIDEMIQKSGRIFLAFYKISIDGNIFGLRARDKKVGIMEWIAAIKIIRTEFPEVIAILDLRTGKDMLAGWYLDQAGRDIDPTLEEILKMINESKTPGS